MSLIVIVSNILFFMLFAFILFVFAIVAVSRKKKNINNDFQPGISIVIPAYNEEKNIAECLGSIINSDYSKDKIEVIVSDDGSTDNTVDIAKNYSAKIIRQEHLGKVEALNNGIAQASNGLVLVIDADMLLGKNCIKEIAKPFLDNNVGACSGVVQVRNKSSIMGMFQNIEYHYNNLIGNGFSKLFKNGLWYFGAIACYRKDVLKKVGLFKKDTETEDMDIDMDIRRFGYAIKNVESAVGYTHAPTNLKKFYNQRRRWWIGGLRTVFKNRDMLSSKYGVSSAFIIINRFFWSFYAIFSLPVMLYWVYYWLPYNSESVVSVFVYLFRWFTLYGPLWVLYKIPTMSFDYFTLFGVVSGILSVSMIIMSLKIFEKKISFRNILAIFFYFPYTILLNIIIVFSLISFKPGKERYFIK